MEKSNISNLFGKIKGSRRKSSKKEISIGIQTLKAKIFQSFQTKVDLGQEFSPPSISKSCPVANLFIAVTK